MAARSEISQRKLVLLQEMRAAYQNGDLVPGTMVPSVRDLARRYDLSVGIVAQQIQLLVQEGLFHTVAGAGTFVGHPPVESAAFFLFVLPGSRRDAQIKMGFEEENARRGCASLSLEPEQVLARLHDGTMPAVQGVFLYRPGLHTPVTAALNAGREGNPLPEVNFAGFTELHPNADIVAFDNVDGGRQAASHLLRAGHRRIAYLGVHAEDDARDIEWSVERLEGWHQALQRGGFPATGLSFLPRRTAARWVEESPELLLEAASRLLAESGATAVVTANDDAAQQLLAACREARLPSAQWPAIVSFDDTVSHESSLLTSLRLPWEDLGRTAATLLWERSRGQLTGSPVLRRLPLRIIPRLTCRANWSRAEALQYTG